MAPGSRLGLRFGFVVPPRAFIVRRVCQAVPSAHTRLDAEAEVEAAEAEASGTATTVTAAAAAAAAATAAAVGSSLGRPARTNGAEAWSK